MAEVDVAGQWERLVGDMLADGTATYGNEGGPRRAFGSTSLKTDDRIFAMLVKGRLVVKLPAARVSQLVDEGAGERFDPGKGRVQKEWLVAFAEDLATWRALAAEAESYVGRRGR